MTIQLVKPLNGPITQYFGERPQIYSQWGYNGHNGIDFGIPVGTSIRASADGVVKVVAWDKLGYGNYVILDHNNNEFLTYYAHQEKTNVKVGDVVKTGAVIGFSGNTGFSTGPHLHWELRIPGKINPGFKNCFDPLKYLVGINPPEEPVEPEEVDYGITLSGVKFEVIVDVLNVRDGPGTSYNKIGTLSEGTIITPTVITSPGEIWVKHETGWSAIMFNGEEYVKTA